MKHNEPGCLKCGATSGDDWSQCEGSCPIPASPHFDPHCELIAEPVKEGGPKAALKRIREGAMMLHQEIEGLPTTIFLGPKVEDNISRALLRVVELCEKREAELTPKIVK
jgi:hypothetical protein